MKIQIQISPITCPVLINRRKHECNSCQPKQKTRRKLHKKVFERIKESKWGTSCKYMWIKHPWYTIELARTLFPVCLTVNRFLARVQSPTCTTYRKFLLESIMTALTPKSGIGIHCMLLRWIKWNSVRIFSVVTFPKTSEKLFQ